MCEMEALEFYERIVRRFYVLLLAPRVLTTPPCIIVSCALIKSSIQSSSPPTSVSRR